MLRALIFSESSMYTGQLVFSQVTDHLPMHTLRRCVAHAAGARKGVDGAVKGMTGKDLVNPGQQPVLAAHEAQLWVLADDRGEAAIEQLRLGGIGDRFGNLVVRPVVAFRDMRVAERG
jgi:hypothetical protein